MSEPTNSPQVEEAFRVLNEAAEIDIPKMSESMFVEHILPMLSAPMGTKVDLTRWLDVAGTPLRGFAVHSDQDGSFLFRVPPLMRTLPTVFQQEVNYSEIVFQAQAKARVVPEMGDRYIASELQKVKTGATLLDIETAQRWNAIRQRYQLPLIPLSGLGIEVECSSGGNSSDGSLTVSDDDEPLF